MVHTSDVAPSRTLTSVPRDATPTRAWLLGFAVASLRSFVALPSIGPCHLERKPSPACVTQTAEQILERSAGYCAAINASA
jgi:hypothetical protein